MSLAAVSQLSCRYSMVGYGAEWYVFNFDSVWKVIRWPTVIMWYLCVPVFKFPTYSFHLTTARMVFVSYIPISSSDLPIELILRVFSNICINTSFPMNQTVGGSDLLVIDPLPMLRVF